MYGIPEDLDVSVLVGARLARMCFGQFIIQLDFDHDRRVSIQGVYEHVGPNAEWTDSHRPPLTNSRLLQLISHSIVEAAVESRRRLRLDFDHGHALHLIDDSAEYEAFQVETPDRQWVI